MIGAALTYVMSDEAIQVIRPGIFMLLLVVVVVLERPWPFRRSLRP